MTIEQVGNALYMIFRGLFYPLVVALGLIAPRYRELEERVVASATLLLFLSISGFLFKIKILGWLGVAVCWAIGIAVAYLIATYGGRHKSKEVAQLRAQCVMSNVMFLASVGAIIPPAVLFYHRSLSARDMFYAIALSVVLLVVVSELHGIAGRRKQKSVAVVLWGLSATMFYAEMFSGSDMLSVHGSWWRGLIYMQVVVILYRYYKDVEKQGSKTIATKVAVIGGGVLGVAVLFVPGIIDESISDYMAVGLSVWFAVVGLRFGQRLVSGNEKGG